MSDTIRLKVDIASGSKATEKELWILVDNHGHVFATLEKDAVNAFDLWPDQRYDLKPAD